MIIKNIDFTLNLIDRKTRNLNIDFVVGDTKSSMFTITLVSKTALSFDGVTAEVIFKKADDNVVVGTASIVNNKIQYILGTNEISYPGTVYASVEIYGSNGERLTTPEFYFNVKESLDSDESVTSTTEYPILTQLINEVSDISSNESARQSQELSRQNEETSRANAELARVTAENDRVAAETDREDTFQNLKTELEAIDVVALTNDFISHLADNLNLYKPVDNYIGLVVHSLSDANAELYSSYGFQKIRIDILWSVVETVHGVYDFSTYDAIVNNAIDNGMSVMLILCYNNTLYAESIETIITTETNMTAFKNYVTACVNRYKEKGVSWEIWNEANHTWTAQQYFDIVVQAYPIIKALDTSGNAIVGAIGNDGEVSRIWFEDCCKLGLLTYADKISLHVYDAPTPEASMSYLVDYQSIAQKYISFKRYIPVVISEFGYSTYSGIPNAPTDSERGDYLIRYLLLGMMYNIDEMYLYEATGLYTSTNPEAYFGMFNADTYAPTTSVTKIKSFFDALEGYRFSSIVSTSGNMYVIKVTNGSDDKFVIWSDYDFNVKLTDGTTVSVNSLPQIVNYLPLNSVQNVYAENVKSEASIRLRPGVKNIGNHSETFNDSNTATGAYSHAEGKTTTAGGESSHSEGDGTSASGSQAHAEGFHTTASGNISHAEGKNTTASKESSHSEGDGTIASGDQSHAEGLNSKAVGGVSHAEGFGCEANGLASHAEGGATKAQLEYSHASGFHTETGRAFQTAMGVYNAVMSDGLLVVGNGSSDAARKNAFEVTDDGAIALYSPSGLRFKIKVDDTGTLVITQG
jgi:hypothetical protein